MLYLFFRKEKIKARNYKTLFITIYLSLFYIIISNEIILVLHLIFNNLNINNDNNDNNDNSSI